MRMTVFGRATRAAVSLTGGSAGHKLTASAATAATCQTLRPCCWRPLIAAGLRRED